MVEAASGCLIAAVVDVAGGAAEELVASAGVVDCTAEGCFDTDWSSASKQHNAFLILSFQLSEKPGAIVARST